MDNLSLAILEPREAECRNLVVKYKELSIKGVDDKEGYIEMHKAKMVLVKTRTDIKKDGKSLRDLTNDFNRAVLKKEKDLIEIIEPLEIDLADKLKFIDEAKEKIARIELLPARKERLKLLNTELSDDEITAMDATEFQTFCNEAKSKQLAAQEASIKAESDRIETERLKLENDKKEEETRKVAAEEARKQAERDIEIAAKKAEQDKQDAIEAEKKKAAEEKQAIIDENNRKESERIKKEKDAKKEEADRIVKEEEDRKKIQAKKIFQDFLKEHGMTNDNKKDYYIKQDGKNIVLFKKIAELELD